MKIEFVSGLCLVMKINGETLKKSIFAIKLLGILQEMESNWRDKKD